MSATFADEAAAGRAELLAQSYANIIAAVPDFPVPPKLTVTRQGAVVRVRSTLEIPDLEHARSHGMRRQGPVAAVQPGPRASVPSGMSRALRPLLVALLAVLPACESAQEIGEHAGIEYVAPFIGVAEAQTEGCDSQLEVAKHMLDLGKAQRAELKPKIEKVKGDEAFKKALLGMAEKANGSTLQRFATDCPTQAAEVTKIAKQTADELGVGDLVPAWPAKG